MNIAIAGGIVRRPDGHMLRNAPPDELDRLRMHAGGGLALDAAYAATNVLNPPPGVGMGAAGAVSALSLLKSDRIPLKPTNS